MDKVGSLRAIPESTVQYLLLQATPVVGAITMVAEDAVSPILTAYLTGLI